MDDAAAIFARVDVGNGSIRCCRARPDGLGEQAIDALRSAELKAKLAEQGSEPVGNTPAEFKAFIDSELVKWRRLVEISGATVQ